MAKSNINTTHIRDTGLLSHAVEIGIETKRAVLLGSQEIRATIKVSDDSRIYKATDGTFQAKDLLGSTLATGCASVTAERY